MASTKHERTSSRATPHKIAGRRSVADERSPTCFKPVRDRVKRSEALIQEQVYLVQDTQDAIQRALDNLEIAASGDHERSEEDLEALLNKSQELIVMVQVLMKIRNELAHSRLDLEKAIKSDVGIERAKKRVKWLQQRLEKVLSSTRTYCQLNMLSPRSQSRAKSVLRREEVSDHLWERLSESQRQRLFITELDDHPDKGKDTSVINEFEKMVPTCPSQDSVHEYKNPFKPPLTPGGQRCKPVSPRDGKSAGVLSSLLGDKQRGKKKKKHKSDLARLSSSSLKNLIQITGPPEELYDGGGDTTPEPASDAEDDHRETISVISSVQIDEEQRQEQSGRQTSGSRTKQSSTTAESESCDASSISEKTDKVSSATTKDKKTDNEEGTPNQVEQEETTDEQKTYMGGEAEEKGYWEMDHHRFEWSDYMQELDPRSWHALGLGQQDSFLAKERPQFQSDLPWKEKPMKVNSVIDVHKIALDKLLVRLHRMYDAIGRATQATIDPLPRDEKLEITMGKRGDADGGSSDGRPLTDVMAAYDSMPVSRDLALPPIPGTANQKSVSFLERYPPTSEPSMTRLARKSSDKLYPRDSGIWCEDVTTGHDMPKMVTTKPLLQKKTSNIQSRYLGTKLAIESPSWSERCETVWKPVVVKRILGAVKRMEPEEGSREKLKSGHVEYDGPKWKRIQVLVGEAGLQSPNPAIASEAAKSIGMLLCRDTEVISALGDVLASNTSARVCYEASRSMILLGNWSPHAMRVVMENMKKGNQHVVSELLNTMTKARNIPFVDKSTPEFRAMVDLLVSLVRRRSFDIAFNAAISLGRLCVVHPYARSFLINKLTTLMPNKKSEALYVLIKQFNCKERIVLSALMEQLKSSYNWKHRLEAADLLIFIGARDVFKVVTHDEVFDVLETLLWDHANKELRQKISDVLGSLGLRQRACALALRRLEDSSEGVRARAVISLATLGMKGVKEMKALLDILELDSSVYVRIQVVRAFSHLEWNDPRILRSLKERERGEGTLATEAGKTLTHLAELPR